MSSQTSCCSSTPSKYSQAAKLMGRFKSVWSLIVVIPVLVYLLDNNHFNDLLSISTTALLGTAPYILIAVLLLGYLKASGAESVVAKAFEGRESRMILLAALFGGLAPFCSCEVIPFIAGLLALGAPLSAVMAFWLSSPLIDPASLMITAGALGWDFAIGKAAGAIFLGLLGGFSLHLLAQTPSFRNSAFANPLKKEPQQSCCSSSSSTSSNNTSSKSTGIKGNSCGEEPSKDKPFKERPQWRFWYSEERRQVFREQSSENALFLLKWLSLAYLLEALLILYVPAELIGQVVGGEGFLPVVWGALVGMPAYLNSYAAPPLVAGLMEQGMSAGSAMAFMLAGAISSIPAMTAVYSLVKRQVFAAYLAFGVGGAILFALIFAAAI